SSTVATPPARLWPPLAPRSRCSVSSRPRRRSHDGVPAHEAMAVSGHQTRSVFDRYSLTLKAQTRAALERLTAYTAADAAPGVRLPRRRPPRRRAATPAGVQYGHPYGPPPRRTGEGPQTQNRQGCGIVSGAEESRTPDLLNAIPLVPRHTRPRPPTSGENTEQ